MAFGAALDEAVVATEEEGVAAAVVEVAVGTETNEWAVGAEEEEVVEGVGEVNNSSNNNKVKVHRRPAEEEAGQKGVEPMPVVEEIPNQLLLLRRLVGSNFRTVVKINLHRSPSDTVEAVVGVVG